jgi:putative intracellular protease/amidase
MVRKKNQKMILKKIIFIILLGISCLNFFAQADVIDTTKIVADTNKLKINLLNHNQVMTDIFGEPRMDIKTIGILVYDGFYTLDAIGPMAVFSELMGTKVFYIGLKKGLVKTGRTEINVTTVIDEVTSLDILVIPGGAASTWQLTQDTSVLRWIQKIDQTTQITASVCTGAWVLGAAGLLEGKKATTHWYRAEEMLKRYGAIYEQKRYTNDGKYWTSAGVTAGMDMSLALIQLIRGDKYVQGAMLDLEYDPQPPIQGGTPEKSDPRVLEMMQVMYDYGMLPLLQKEDKRISKMKSSYNTGKMNKRNKNNCCRSNK